MEITADCNMKSPRGASQIVLPSADTAAMLFWALPASGQINMRKINAGKPLATKTIRLIRERHMAGDHAASIATTFPDGTK